jgi:rubrerythrin
LKNVQEEWVFRRETPALWKCRNCGYIHEGRGVPELCTACAHPKAHYELLSENW